MHSHRIGMRAALAAVAAFSAAECAAYITDAQAAADAVGSGYTRLEYVFVNNVVFKTGYQTQSGDSAQIDVLFAPSTKPCASMVPFFSRTGTSANLLSMWYWRPDSTTTASQGNLRFDYASSGDDNKATPTPEIADNVKYRFTLSSGAATAINLSTGTPLTLNNSEFTSGTAEGAYMWLLGGTGGNTSTQAGSGTLKYFCTNTRFYDFQVSNAGTVKCHYVPVRRKSDGAIGLLDIAVSNGEFVEPTRGDGALVFAGPATRDGSIDVRVAPLLGDGYIVPYVTRWGQSGAANLYIPTAGGGGGLRCRPAACRLPARRRCASLNGL